MTADSDPEAAEETPVSLKGSTIPGTRPIACIDLPTYNEAANISVLLPQVFSEAAKILSHDLHVLVVDDESPDGTADVVRSLMPRFPNLRMISGKKQGLGAAYRRGMAYAIRTMNPELILQMDADLQHSADLIPLFIVLTQYGFSLTIGSRFAPGGSTPDFSLRRRLLSRLGNGLIRFVGGLPRIHDCTSGYRCIRADLVAKCDFSHLSTRGYSFQASLLFELLRNGARPIEVPIVFASRASGKSKLGVRDQLEFLVNVFRLRFRHSVEFAKYCFVGSLGVLVNSGVYFALTRVWHMAMAAASPIAIETAILSNFAFNSLWSYCQKTPDAGGSLGFFRFHLVGAGGGVVNYVVLLLVVHTWQIWDMTSNLVGILIGTVVTYFLNSLWTWKEGAVQ